MTLTKEALDSAYAHWFQECKNPEQAKREILERFSEEPDEYCTWSEQDIFEQARKMIEQMK